MSGVSGGRRPGSVPSWLWLLRAAVLVAAAGLAGVLVAGGVSANGSWMGVRECSVPQVMSTTGAYSTPKDTDAQFANELMAGDTASRSVLRTQAAANYDQRRGQAGGYPPEHHAAPSLAGSPRQWAVIGPVRHSAIINSSESSGFTSRSVHATRRQDGGV